MLFELEWGYDLIFLTLMFLIAIFLILTLWLIRYDFDLLFNSLII